MAFEILGYISGFFYIICYLPQIYNIWNKSSNKLDLRMIYLQGVAAILMTCYAILNKLYPILLLNTMTIVSVLLILWGAKRSGTPIEDT